VRDVVFLTTPGLIDRHWPDAAALIDPGVQALARGEWNTDDLGDLVRSGRATAALMLEDGAPVLSMVFEFRHYPKRTMLNVMALGGSNLAPMAMTFWPRFLEWTRNSGATHVEACAGPAMTRVLRGLGFEHAYNLLRIEV
jgi:hypothetical protein